MSVRHERSIKFLADEQAGRWCIGLEAAQLMIHKFYCEYQTDSSSK